MHKYLAKGVFKGQRKFSMNDVALGKDKTIIFCVGSIEKKPADMFDELSLQVMIPFSEVETFVTSKITPYIESVLGKKITKTDFNWGKRKDGYYHLDDAMITFHLMKARRKKK